MCGRVCVYMYAYNTDINAQVVRYHGVGVDMFVWHTPGGEDSGRL